MLLVGVQQVNSTHTVFTYSLKGVNDITTSHRNKKLAYNLRRLEREEEETGAGGGRAHALPHLHRHCLKISPEYGFLL
jgi:hypothetical protein